MRENTFRGRDREETWRRHGRPESPNHHGRCRCRCRCARLRRARARRVRGGGRREPARRRCRGVRRSIRPRPRSPARPRTQAGGLAQDTASVPAPSAIREPVERAAVGSEPISPTTARPARPSGGRVAGPRAPAAAGGGAARRPRADGPRRGSARDRGRHASPTTSSPPHGRKAMPPARSLPERAGAARAAYPHSAAPVPQHAPGDTGLADRTRGLSAPGGVFLAALLIASSPPRAHAFFARFGRRRRLCAGSPSPHRRAAGLAAPVRRTGRTGGPIRPVDS